MAKNNGDDVAAFLAHRLREEGTYRAGPMPGREYMVRLNLALPISTFQQIDKAVSRLNQAAKRERRPEKQNRSTLGRVAFALLLGALNGELSTSPDTTLFKEETQ